MAGTAPAILQRIMNEPFPPLAGVMPDIVTPAQQMLAGLVAKDPRARYPSARMLAEDCDALLRGEELRFPAGLDRPGTPVHRLRASTAPPWPVRVIRSLAVGLGAWRGRARRR